MYDIIAAQGKRASQSYNSYTNRNLPARKMKDSEIDELIDSNDKENLNFYLSELILNAEVLRKRTTNWD